MTRAPAYRSGPSRLVWNQVSPDKWQAGGLTRTYVIRRDRYREVLTEWTLSLTLGDLTETIGGSFADLANAQRRAQEHLDGRHRVEAPRLPRTGKAPVIVGYDEAATIDGAAVKRLLKRVRREPKIIRCGHCR